MSSFGEVLLYSLSLLLLSITFHFQWKFISKALKYLNKLHSTHQSSEQPFLPFYLLLQLMPFITHSTLLLITSSFMKRLRDIQMLGNLLMNSIHHLHHKLKILSILTMQMKLVITSMSLYHYLLQPDIRLFLTCHYLSQNQMNHISMNIISKLRR